MKEITGTRDVVQCSSTSCICEALNSISNSKTAAKEMIEQLNQSANGVEPIFPTANFRRHTDANKSCYIQ